MLRNELPELVDDCDRIQVAIALRFSPSEEPVTAEKDAIAIRCSIHGFTQHHGQLKTRPLPGQPNQLVRVRSIELFHFVAAIRRSGESDTPVRMQMIDMFKRKKRVQRSVNRSGNRIPAENAQGIQANHLIFGIGPAITSGKCVQLL